MSILLVLALVRLCLAGGLSNDMTCISSRPNFSPNEPVQIFGVGPDALPIQFKRYLASGTTQDVNSGNQEQLSEDVEVLKLPPSPKKQSDHRAGVFSCSSSSHGTTSSILVINHRKNSNVLPNGFVTKTVNLGDSVTLSIESHSSKVKWRKGGVKMSQWNGLKSVTLNNVTVEDDGIYEAFTCMHSPHANMRLIVRDITACTCYNGGVCSDSQDCICPPGFTGDSCENVHNANCFGAQCQYLCDDDEFPTDGIFNGTCGGNLFCLPDPYGCSCSPGYRGLGCDEECEEGTFGSDCTQTCHCLGNGICDNKMGFCSPGTCEDGWTGENCNQKVTCRHEPCQNGGECHDDVEAQEYWCICRPGFTGENCELIEIHQNLVCENSRMTLTCNSDNFITITEAMYGRQVPGSIACDHSNIKTTSCNSTQSFSVMSTKCNGKSTCDFAVTNEAFNGDPCRDTYKYLNVTYQCI